MSVDHSIATLALRVVAMPRDTNPNGTIFGGVIMSYLDQAAYLQARRHWAGRWVTVAIDRVEFQKPVFVGDAVNFFARTVKCGRTSVTIEVDVQAERFERKPGEEHAVSVTTATVIMVAIDNAGRSYPFANPGKP
jgi:acyl-CoA thioesterase YciA